MAKKKKGNVSGSTKFWAYGTGLCGAMLIGHLLWDGTKGLVGGIDNYEGIEADDDEVDYFNEN